MKAVVYEDVRTVGVHDVTEASLEADSDAVVRVTSSAVCGTGLHMYDGRTGATPGLVLGHEPLGVVEQVGSCVETITPGMRVVIPTHLYCGTCHMCARGLSAACLRARPDGVGAAYGYAGMGPYRRSARRSSAASTRPSMRFGRTHDRRYTTRLRDLITSGRARPGTIVTHHGSLDDAPELYRRFDKRENGVIKAVLHPSSH